MRYTFRVFVREWEYIMELSEKKSYIYIFISGILWGLSGIFVKYLTGQGASALLISCWRLIPAFFFLASVTVARYGFKALKIDGRTMAFCALTGLVTQALFNICYNTAIATIGMSVSAVLLYVAPVVTAVSAAIVFSEKITGKKAVALFINILGCVLTVTGGSLNAGNLVLSGVLFGVGAGVCYGMVAILGRVTTAKVNPFVAITWTFFFGSIFILLFVRPWNEAVIPTSAGFITVGLLFALIPTTFSYLFYFSGVSVIKETSKVPVIASVEPVVATLIGVIIYHESIGVVNVLGILLVIGSIVLMNQKQLD